MNYWIIQYQELLHNISYNLAVHTDLLSKLLFNFLSCFVVVVIVSIFVCFFVFWQGGEAKDYNGKIIKLNGRVLAPEWYWKAVCDPVKKQSVFFLGENTITDTEDNQKEVEGCFKIRQHKHSGVINCLSLNDAKTTFKRMFQIPDFHVKNCDPSKIGDDFRVVLQNSLV